MPFVHAFRNPQQRARPPSFPPELTLLSGRASLRLRADPESKGKVDATDGGNFRLKRTSEKLWRKEKRLCLHGGNTDAFK